jgi:hypothetical protein
MMKPYAFPLYRYQVTNEYYILLSTRINKAEVGIVKNKSQVNDFMLWTGFKTIKEFHADTPRKALNKAKRWIQKQKAEQ